MNTNTPTVTRKRLWIGRTGAWIGTLGMVLTLHGQQVTYFDVVDFETGDFSQCRRKCDGCSHNGSQSPTIVTSPVRGGRYASKCTQISGRTEWSGQRVPLDTDLWAGWSLYIPHDWPNNTTHTVSQYAGYQPPCHDGANFHLKIRNNQWGVWLRHMGSTSQDIYGLKPVTKGKWTDIVLHARWSYSANGFLRLYIDGDLVLSRNGRTMVDCPLGPYFKAGVYAGPDGATLYADEYRVARTSDGGSYATVVPGGGSPPPSGDCTAPPLAPTNVVASPGNGQITVSWSPVACATSYTVFRDGVAIQVGLAATSFTDTGVSNGVGYCYAVRGVNTHGAGTLSTNSCATAGVISCDGPPGTARPSAVSGDGVVWVFWPAVACATTYTVFRDGTAIAADVTATEYRDTNVVNGLDYCYAVRALNTNGPGPLSDSVCARPQGGTGLVGHWAFEEGSGMTTADLSGNGNTGTLVGAVSWTNGIVGDHALNFPGLSSARVEISASAASLQITGAVTLAAWIRPNVANQSTHLVGRAGGSSARGYQLITEGAGGDATRPGAFGLRLSSNGLANAAVTLYTPTNIMKANEWMHVAGVFDPSTTPSTMRIYTNGVLCAEMTTPSKSMAVPAGIQPRIGVRGDNTGGFNGRIDEARIYNRALGAAEVLELYRGGVVPPAPEDLTGWAEGLTARLEWEAVGGAHEYVVLRSQTEGGPYTPVGTNATPGFMDTGLVAGMTYFYVVRARNSWGDSKDSEAVVVSTAAAGPVRVLSIQAGLVGADTVVTMEAVGTAGYGYGLERAATLETSGWNQVQARVASTNGSAAGQMIFHDTNPPTPAYYRVRHPPAP